MKKIIAGMFCIVICVLLGNTHLYAATYIDDSLKVNSVGNEKNELSRSSTIPVSYDSRNNNVITRVKNQDEFGTYGTCWTFATLGASESMLASKLGFNGADMDLSEMQLLYFAYHHITDPLGGTAGDANLSGSTDYRKIGGNANLSVSTLASWIGPVNESEITYNNVTDSSYVPDSKYAYEYDVAHLQNSYFISMKDTDIVKNMIMEYGSAQMSFRWSTTYHAYNTASYYNYYSTKAGIGHAVTLIGWDDNYSATNFKTAPAGDGAWLVKNSWGTNWGNDGYFWISYYDVGVNNSAAYVFDYEANDNYDYNYQYDGCADLGRNVKYSEQESAYMANVFTANSYEVLEAVSFYLLDVNMDYEIQIYRGGTDDANPISGSPVLSIPQSGHQELQGYYTVKLDTPVQLQQGEKFVVVIKLTKEGGVVQIPVEATEDVGYLTTAYSKRGQSYTSSNGTTWTDRCSEGNVRIKAFTSKEYITDCQIKTLPEKRLYMYGEELSLKGGTVVLTYKSGIEKEMAMDDMEFAGYNSKISGSHEVILNCEGYELKFNVIVQLSKINSIKLSQLDYKSLQVSWSQVNGAQGYKIYRRNSNKEAEYTLIGQVGNEISSFNDLDVIVGNTYKYRVCAVKDLKEQELEGPYSDVKKIKVKMPGTIIMSKVYKSNGIYLTWKKVTAASGYTIYRSTGKGGKYSKIKTVSSSKIKYLDAKAKPGKKYYYKIKAYKRVDGEYVYSAYSDMI